VSQSQFNAAAALTAGLLARKGAATPATLAPRQPRFASGLDAPAVPFGKAAPFPAVERTASEAAPAAHRQRLTLRLDDRRHLHLRLMSAHFGLSRQELIVRALDEFLERHAAGTSAEHCQCLRVAGGTNGADDDGRACCAER
jgi:hypothetical protein